MAAASDAAPAKQRCVVVMYDTLCRHFIPSYGNDWIIAPNFNRLSQRAVQVRPQLIPINRS
eukprot:SAG31_NODE_16320_length_713_cov_1.459283_1_plen_61_part_00